MGAKGLDEANAVLNQYLRGTSPALPSAFYLALLTADPGPLEDMSSEVANAEYARQPISYPVATTGSVANNGEVMFPVVVTSWGTILFAAIVDTLTGPPSILMYYGPLSVPVTPMVGDVVQLKVGQGVVTES